MSITNKLRRQPMSAATTLALCVALAACSTSAPGSRAQGASVSRRPPRASRSYYVSLGDSYAAGYQPVARGHGSTTTNGFAYQLVGVASHRGLSLTLQNFACSGATTSSIIGTPGCRPGALGPGASPYHGQTQAQAAETFLRAHRGHIALVTISIGGNDVIKCALSATPLTCVSQAVNGISTNLAVLLRGVRDATGPSVPIIGITYPDVTLGLWVVAPSLRSLALLSVTAFKSLINPALKKQYEAVGGRFVDVTAATGAYTSLAVTTSDPPYGTVPTSVAEVCRLTFFCRFQDIHPTTSGYSLIARLVAADLPVKRAP